MDWGRVGVGVATGGQSEVVRAGLGLLGGKQKTELEAMLTPEQRAAMAKLGSFAETGTYNDFTAGAEVPLGYGDYRMSDIEGDGLSSLQSLLRSGIPDQYKLGDAALRDILDTSPEAIDREFQPFKALATREMANSDAALRRRASYAGNLYSTDTIRQLGDLEARGAETMTAELARLSNAAKDRRLAAVPLAMQSAQAQEGAALNRIVASQELGSLTRRLNDAKIKERDAELLRRRQELQLPIQAATALAGANVNFGIPSVETSPYQELLAMVGQIGGTYLGNYAGARGAAAGKKAGA